MSITHSIILLSFFVCCLSTTAPASLAFNVEVVAGNDKENPLNHPVNILFAPDDRILILERGGRVRILYPNGTLDPAPWLDISDIVTQRGDRGLLGGALDPNFTNNGYVYLLYVQEPVIGQQTPDSNAITQSRLVRYTEVNGRADTTSELILIGEKMGDGWPVCFNSHSVGDVHFGSDGTLYITHGESAHWDRVDDGSPQSPIEIQCAQVFPNQNFGAFRAQSLTSLGGKLLRLDPKTGHGIGPLQFPHLEPNPFYENGDSPKDRIWATGFRNPFRFELFNYFGVDVVFVGDVGWASYEEIDLVVKSGSNYGWPCREGNLTQPEYRDPGITAYGANFCTTNFDDSTATDPLITYPHREIADPGTSLIGNCIGGVAVTWAYNFEDIFPDHGKADLVMFFGDFSEQWINVALLIPTNDSSFSVVSVAKFGEQRGSVVTLKLHPKTNQLYFVDVFAETVSKYSPRSGSEKDPPSALVSVPLSGSILSKSCTTFKGTVGFLLPFSSDGTLSVWDQNFPLKYLWTISQGTTLYPTSSLPNPQLCVEDGGDLDVMLQVTDRYGRKTKTQMKVDNSQFPGNKAVITWQSQLAISQKNVTPVGFETGDEMITFSATPSFYYNSSGPYSYQWLANMVHNNHIHFEIMTADTPTFTANLFQQISKIERNLFQIQVLITDLSKGATAQGILYVYPQGMPELNRPPTSDFTFDVKMGKTVIFAVNGSFDADQDYLEYRWDWGDGQIGVGQSTTHTFATVGNYNVSMTVSDPFGASFVATKQITITADPPTSSAGIPIRECVFSLIMAVLFWFLAFC